MSAPVALAGVALLLLLLGIGASFFGALAGLGGAFIALPILRLAGVPAQTAAAGALAMVFANAASASWTFWHQRRIDVRVALLLAATGVPAAIAGAYAVQSVSNRNFDFLLAGLQFSIAVSVVWRALHPPSPRSGGNRTLRDAFGVEHRYDVHPALLLGAGLVVGFASSFFGIGGGIVTVPLLILALGMPPHLATATSSFAILLTSPVGIATHFVLESAALTQTLQLSLVLAAGGLIGGHLGARLAPKVRAGQLTWILAALLIAASIGLSVRHLPALGG